MGVLSDDQHKEIISWLNHGKAFRIHDRRAFEQQILPTHFRKSSQFKSFQRKLSRWGFLKVPNGEDAGAYYHASFQRGDYRSLSQISTVSIATKGTTTRTTSQEPSAQGGDERQEYKARARTMSEKTDVQTTRNSSSSLSSSGDRRVQTVSPPFRGAYEEDQQGISKSSAINSASLPSHQHDPQGQHDNSPGEALRRMIESAMASAYNEGGVGGRPNHHQIIQALQDNRRDVAGIGDASSTLREDSNTVALANALSDLLCANHRQEVQQPQEQIAGAAQRHEHRSRDELAAAHRLVSLVGGGGGVNSTLCPPPGHPHATDLMIQMAASGQLGGKNALYQLPTTSAVTHDARNAAILPYTQQFQPSHHLSMQHFIEGIISHQHQQRPEQQQLLTDDSSSNRHLMGLLSLLQSSTGIPAAHPPPSSLLQRQQNALQALLSSSSQHQDRLSNAVQTQQVALPSILPSSSSVIAQHAMPTAAISEQHISTENSSTLRLIRDLLLMAPQSDTQPKSAR